MGNNISQEKSNNRIVSVLKGLGSLAFSLTPELIVASLTYAIFMKVDILPWYKNIMLSALISILYGVHNKVILERLKNETKKGMNDVAERVRQLSDIDLPSLNMELNESLSKFGRIFSRDIVETVYRLPKFVELGCEIERTKDSCDSEIIDGVLDDQCGLLQKGEHILTLKGYLDLVHKFGDVHHELYCVNITLPIFWFSPRPSDREFVEAYASDIEKQRIITHRLTVIKTEKVLREQFKNAFDEIRTKWGNRELLLWCSVLFQQLIHNTDDPIYLFVMQELNNDSLKGKFKSIIVDSFERERAELGLLGDKNAEELKQLLSAYFNIRKYKDYCDIINQRIIMQFVAKYKEEGSFYVTKDTLVHAFKGTLDIKNYGELGVYVLNDNPCKAFATIGEFGSLIKIKSMSQHDIFNILRVLIEKAKKIPLGPEIGSMKHLYEKR